MTIQAERPQATADDLRAAAEISRRLAKKHLRHPVWSKVYADRATKLEGAAHQLDNGYPIERTGLLPEELGWCAHRKPPQNHPNSSGWTERFAASEKAVKEYFARRDA